MSKRKIAVIIIVLIFVFAIILSLFYYKDKYEVSFETGSNEKILTKYVSKNDKITAPKEPTKEGYIFVEWQLDGEKYNFDTAIDKDITLTAKWMHEEYITITYITDSNYSIEPIKILKGTSVTNIPIAYKDGYEFIGWFINDKVYDDEVLNDDTTLIAKYKLKNIEYKVGDKIIIIGNYSSSAYNLSAKNSMALGWERYILSIIEGTNYPYMIGNEEGVTGFFNKESIKLLKEE